MVFSGYVRSGPDFSICHPCFEFCKRRHTIRGVRGTNLWIIWTYRSCNNENYRFDIELIFPELVGHTGVVSKPNVLGKFTSYNLSVEIEKAGLYGNSFWHGNNVAARSKGILKKFTNIHQNERWIIYTGKRIGLL